MNRDGWNYEADKQRSRHRANDARYESEGDRLVLKMVILAALSIAGYFIWQFSR